MWTLFRRRRVPGMRGQQPGEMAPCSGTGKANTRSIRGVSAAFHVGQHGNRSDCRRRGQKARTFHLEHRKLLLVRMVHEAKVVVRHKRCRQPLGPLGSQLRNSDSGATDAALRAAPQMDVKNSNANLVAVLAKEVFITGVLEPILAVARHAPTPQSSSWPRTCRRTCPRTRTDISVNRP